MLQFPIWSYCL